MKDELFDIDHLLKKLLPNVLEKPLVYVFNDAWKYKKWQLVNFVNERVLCQCFFLHLHILRNNTKEKFFVNGFGKEILYT